MARREGNASETISTEPRVPASGGGRSWAPRALLVRTRMAQPPWRAACRHLQTFNAEFPSALAVLFLGTDPKELEAGLKRVFVHHVHASAIHTSRKAGATAPIDR